MYHLIADRRAEFERDNRRVMTLLARLTTFRVDWSRARGKHDPNDMPDYEPLIDREEADLDKANIVSSRIRQGPFEDKTRPRHVLAIDLDIPAYLVPSSTHGHSHLYVETKNGIPHHRYMALLHALADAGIIEEGYAQVSIARGHSDLRLPWVRKDDEIPGPPTAPLPQPAAPPPLPRPDTGGDPASYFDF